MRGPAPEGPAQAIPARKRAASRPDASPHPAEKRERQTRPSSSGEPPFPHPEKVLREQLRLVMTSLSTDFA